MKVLPRVFLIVVLAVLLVGLYQITLDTKAWAALCCEQGFCNDENCSAASGMMPAEVEYGPGPESCPTEITLTCRDCIAYERTYDLPCQITLNCYCWQGTTQYKSYRPGCVY